MVTVDMKWGHWQAFQFHVYLSLCLDRLLNVKAEAAAFNLEKAPVGDFSLIDRKTLNFVKACFQL